MGVKKKSEKLQIHNIPSVQLSKWTLLKGALAALIVRLAFYFLVSLIMVGLFSWAGISVFNFKYVFVLTVGLFFFYLLFGKFTARY